MSYDKVGVNSLISPVLQLQTEGNNKMKTSLTDFV